MKFISTLLVLAFSSSAFASYLPVAADKREDYRRALSDAVAAAPNLQCQQGSLKGKLSGFSGVDTIISEGDVSIDNSGSQPVVLVDYMNFVITFTTTSDYRKIAGLVFREYSESSVNEGTIIAPNYQKVRSVALTVTCGNPASTAPNASLK